MDYGYSSEVNSNDDRQPKWAEQRATRGFDDTELWNLDSTFARFIVPRLKVYREQAKGTHPGYLETEQAWQDILQQMIDGLELLIDDTFGDLEAERKKDEKIDAAVRLFAEHFRTLWL